VGTYHIFCAEYCGTRHSGMIGRVVVMPQNEYEAWLGGAATEGTLAQRGEKLFSQLPASRATAPTRRAAGRC
jgi:cytochrome c oxidase subunit 2